MEDFNPYNVVIIGRGSQYILRDRKDTYHILLVANREQRVKFMEKNYNLTPREAVRVIDGQVKRRAWGDVVTIDLRQAQQTVFSFQIARRSVQLHQSSSAGWTDVFLDSLADLIASKMVALVERGAPRDFRDIFEVCRTGLTTPQKCWAWWEQRQQLAGSDSDHYRARLAVETHLARISQHRPLEQIDDPHQRAAAQEVRHWFLREFLNALSD